MYKNIISTAFCSYLSSTPSPLRSTPNPFQLPVLVLEIIYQIHFVRSTEADLLEAAVLKKKLTHAFSRSHPPSVAPQQSVRPGELFFPSSWHLGRLDLLADLCCEVTIPENAQRFLKPSRKHSWLASECTGNSPKSCSPKPYFSWYFKHKPTSWVDILQLTRIVRKGWNYRHQKKQA